MLDVDDVEEEVVPEDVDAVPLEDAVDVLAVPDVDDDVPLDDVPLDDVLEVDVSVFWM